MRRFKLKRINVVIMIIGVMLLSGCGIEEDSIYDKTLDNGGAYREEISQGHQSEPRSSETTDEKETNKSDKKESVNNKELESLKIVSLYNMDSETENLDESIELLEQRIHKYNGYISSHKITVDKARKGMPKEAKMTFRVPRDKVSDMISFIKDAVHVVEESSESIDVTERFYDVEADIKSLHNQETQLNNLYEQAKDVDEVMLIEEKLSSIIREKDLLTRKFMSMEDKSTYARIDIVVNEVKEVVEPEDGRSTNILSSLMKSFDKAKRSLTKLLSVVAENVHLIIVFMLMIWGYRKYLKPIADKMRLQNEVEDSKINDLDENDMDKNDDN